MLALQLMVLRIQQSQADVHHGTWVVWNRALLLNDSTAHAQVCDIHMTTVLLYRFEGLSGKRGQAF